MRHYERLKRSLVFSVRKQMELDNVREIVYIFPDVIFTLKRTAKEKAEEFGKYVEKPGAEFIIQVG